MVVACLNPKTAILDTRQDMHLPRIVEQVATTGAHGSLSVPGHGRVAYTDRRNPCPDRFCHQHSDCVFPSADGVRLHQDV